ncbi:site-specific integrase (plasmid) [Hymenobacter sp. 5317J-9]|uniref:tyrosine-type recombinase/integrase n=1 Tax=Hymenobacter sp. 5317J-9 TaxID=2932250 RepID=UPI001FD69C42|nr:site-specific integrase [Hymenobacter sp. 5317J-9]UOR00133.1 site-specific integrase [Hymenobacter sp. 5317J-9]
MSLQHRFPTLFEQPHAGEWLTEQESLRPANTVSAYGYALVDYFRYCAIHAITPASAKRAEVVAYVRDLSERSKSTTHALPGKRVGYVRSTTHEGFANATVRLRLTTVRLYYKYLKGTEVLATNPVEEGVYGWGKRYSKARRGWVARLEKEFWLPNARQWQAILDAASSECIRNRFMLALAYDAGLRRAELCALQIRDIDPSSQLIKLRPETTKTGVAREVPYSDVTAELFAAYLEHRQSLGQPTGPLFLSESRRNPRQPLTIWSWSKTVQALGKRAGLPMLTTHTLRHLRLTDLAKANWELPIIAAFAGHRSVATTMRYIHLSGRELTERYRQTLNSILDQRQETMKTSLL